VFALVADHDKVLKLGVEEGLERAVPHVNGRVVVVGVTGKAKSRVDWSVGWGMVKPKVAGELSEVLVAVALLEHLDDLGRRQGQAARAGRVLRAVSVGQTESLRAMAGLLLSSSRMVLKRIDNVLDARFWKMRVSGLMWKNISKERCAKICRHISTAVFLATRLVPGTFIH
jgi:hypothetical protein